jgi:peroxiredoxin
VTELLPAGATAPDFELEASDGRRVHLADELAEGHVLLVFYPENDTPG